MITFKISGAKYNIPTAWGDVTYSQYVALLKTPNNLIDYIALFTGIERDTLAKAELRGLEKIALVLTFLTIPPKFEAGPTKMVGPYILPKDVTLQSLGQFEDLRGLMHQLPKKDISEYSTEDNLKISDLYLEACAIYVQKIIDGNYDPQRVPEVKEILKNYSCMEVLRTGAFFFYKPITIYTNTTSHYRSIIPRLKKLLQDFPGYQKSLDFLQRYSKQPSK